MSPFANSCIVAILFTWCFSKRCS